MTRDRRGVVPEDTPRWVFNRVAEAYAARPPYPAALVDAIAAMVPPNGTIGDIGAGIGHLAIPLAERGFSVVAVEPAEAMLGHLGASALARALPIRQVHAKAECLPLNDASLDLIVVADALHFLNVELAAREFFRVLSRRGALAVVIVEFGATEYMQQVARAVHEAAQRQPRRTGTAVRQLGAMARVPLVPPRRFYDATEVAPEVLEHVLRSISFVGPAMNRERFARLWQQIVALDERPVWARSFTLHSGRKSLRARAPGPLRVSSGPDPIKKGTPAGFPG